MKGQAICNGGKGGKGIADGNEELEEEERLRRLQVTAAFASDCGVCK
jgi:hypothetical protein